MSYNYGACYDDMLAKEDIEKLCPEEYCTFMKLANGYEGECGDIGFNAFCEDYVYSDLMNTETGKLFQILSDKFLEVTRLYRLSLGYAGGDIIESVSPELLSNDNRGYFSTDVSWYLLTKNAEKLLKMCPNSNRISWVSGG